ncbi:ArsR family transcriptional regulator [Pontiella desulfatans]|uniref:ArsR family transcriptional regulator n=1 Tax=Pontiella desulfatans TaxID=2750659 RepID=UPI001443D350|nr:ArsR family transcriptional regulator [Pontiella desulfatans]
MTLLRALISHPECTVSGLAEAIHVSKGVASTNLRAINARGLITSRQAGKYVFYSAQANPHVDNAPEILEALEAAFSAGMSNGQIIHCATAFTNRRRIEIVRVLRHGVRSLRGLLIETDIPHPALHRHLRKLTRRDVVFQEDSLYSLKTPAHPFAGVLLEIATA